MNKPELAAEISNATGLTIKKSHEIVTAITDLIMDAVAVDDSVRIKGFGSFCRQYRKARRAIHPKTGQISEHPAYYTAVFRPSGALKAHCLSAPRSGAHEKA